MMRAEAPPLGQAFSVYLDLLRFLAALAVVAAHYVHFGVVQEGDWGLATALGREAVILFFVLSGFVIAASTAQRRPSARAYAEARLSRIYSVALPVLLLAFASAFLLREFSGIEVARSYVLNKAYIYLPLHLLFLGQHWTLTEVPPFMVPYWSLCYEAWFYALFGLACYLRGTRRVLAIGMVLVYIGYKMWLLLPVWLAGVWLYHRRGPLLQQGIARAGCALTIVLLAAWVALDLEPALRAAGIALWPFPALPLGSADRYLADYVVGLVVLAHFACARDAGMGALMRVAAPVRLLASYTFILYLSHALVIGLWRALYPRQGYSAADQLLLGAAIVLATIALGAVTERRRGFYGALVARLLGSRKPVPEPESLSTYNRS